MVRAGAVTVVVVAATACLPSSSLTVRPDEKPDVHYAYLYGRFHVSAQPRKAGGSYATMAFRISCADRLFYTVPFFNTREIQVVRIWPSRCSLTAVQRYDERGRSRGPVDVNPASVTVRTFEAGRAYYLGDYFGKAGIEYDDRGDHLHRYRAWDMNPVDDRFESTTAEMRRAYPALASLVVEDKRLVPAAPTGTKPGALEIHDPNEPTMTPQRIARIAAFVKRSYPTPAACEAACRTGRCLPYRGPAGAAMTCIHRCNADKDCPQGLACNCPNDEKPDGPDCRPLASTPEDKLARVCLPVASTAAPPSQPPPPVSAPLPPAPPTPQTGDGR